MTLYALFQYIHYKWHAKTRHGIHSPFVYAFIDNVLRKQEKNFAADIVHYFQCKEIHFWGTKGKAYDAVAKALPDMRIHIVNVSEDAAKLSPPDLIWIDGAPPEEWRSIYNAYKSSLPSKTIIALSHIYATRQHTHAWQQLCSDVAVRMSIDVFKAGLLFFRKEFKEKQYFVVQARAL